MKIEEFLKGILIGIAKIIPGLSGSILMISFNLYDRAINAITNFFSNIKDNFLFLANLTLGIVIGISLFSNILSYFITNYYTYTTSLFIGLILGGVPLIRQSRSKTPKGVFLSIFFFLSMTIIATSSVNTNYIIRNNFFDYIIFFGAGILEAIGTIIPGISSTALLMLIGIYNTYLNILSHLFNVNYLISNLRFIIPFSLGMFISVIILSILIDYLFKNYRNLTFSSILGISLSATFILILRVVISLSSISEIFFSLILLVCGYIITKKI